MTSTYDGPRTWAEIDGVAPGASVIVNGFNKSVVPAATPDGKRTRAWRDLFVMVRCSAGVELDPSALLELVALLRLKSNRDGDICRTPEVMAACTGVKQDTLKGHIDPTRNNPHPITKHVHLRTDWDEDDTAEDPDYPGAPLMVQRHAYAWRGDDGKTRWRLDVPPIEFAEDGSRLSEDDKWFPVYYWWIWKDPAETGGDTWVLRGERNKVAAALKAAAVVANNATRHHTHGFKGVPRAAKELGVSERTLNYWYAAAEDLGLIGVDHRYGGRNETAVRWIRKAPDSPASGTPRRTGTAADALVSREARETAATEEAELRALTEVLAQSADAHREQMSALVPAGATWGDEPPF